MDDVREKLENKIKLLKEARFKLLRLHKLLIDIERESFERANGAVSSGQFLQILLNDANFSWLRKFSTFIVGIDETLDLSDGYTEAMIDKLLSGTNELLRFNEEENNEFGRKFGDSIRNNSEVREKYEELKNLLA